MAEDTTSGVDEALTPQKYEELKRKALVPQVPGSDAEADARSYAAEAHFHATYEANDKPVAVLMYVAASGPMVIEGPVSATKEDAEMMFQDLVGEPPEDNPDAAIFPSIIAVRNVIESLAQAGHLTKYEGAIEGTPVIFVDITSRAPKPVVVQNGPTAPSRTTLSDYVYTAGQQPNGATGPAAPVKKKKKKSMAVPLIVAALIAAGAWKLTYGAR